MLRQSFASLVFAMGALSMPVFAQDVPQVEAPVGPQALPAPMECPETAEQDLYNLEQDIKAGKVTNGQVILTTVLKYTGLCMNRSVVQAQAAEFYFGLTQGVQDPKQQFKLIAMAYSALVQNDRSYIDPELFPAAKVTITDTAGNEVELDLYDESSALLRDNIMPSLYRFQQGGYVHPIFEAKPLNGCPYMVGNNESGRARDEALGLLLGVETLHNPKVDVTGAAKRVLALAGGCPEQAPFLNLVAGKIYAAGADLKASAGLSETAETLAQEAFVSLGAFLSSDAIRAEDEGEIDVAAALQDHLLEFLPHEEDIADQVEAEAVTEETEGIISAEDVADVLTEAESETPDEE